MKSKGNRTLGIVLIGFGILFLFHNLGVWHSMMNFIWQWEVLFVAIGVALIVGGRHVFIGSILTVIGVVGFIPDLLHYTFRTLHYLWPVALIIVGFIMFRSSRKQIRN